MDARIDRACQDIQRSVDALVEAMRVRAQREAFERSLATRTIDLPRQPEPALGTPRASPTTAPLATPAASHTEPLMGLLTQLEGRVSEAKSAGEALDRPDVAPSKSVMQQLRGLLVQLEAQAWWHRRGRGG